MSYVGRLVDALKRPAIEAHVASMPGFMGLGTVDGTDLKGVERSATGYMVERDNLHLIISPPDSRGQGADALPCGTTRVRKVTVALPGPSVGRPRRER